MRTHRKPPLHGRVIGAGAVLAGLGATAAGAQSNGDQAPDGLSETLIPVASQLVLGVIIGFCVGFLVKKVGKLLAIFVGLAFILLQVLAYFEVITINWPPIAVWWEQARRPGELERHWSTVRAVLFANVPALVGAVPGLILGLKKG